MGSEMCIRDRRLAAPRQHHVAIQQQVDVGALGEQARGFVVFGEDLLAGGKLLQAAAELEEFQRKPGLVERSRLRRRGGGFGGRRR